MKNIVLLLSLIFISCLGPKITSHKKYVVYETAVKEIKILQEFGEDARLFVTEDGRVFKCRLHETEAVRVGDSVGLKIDEFFLDDGTSTKYTEPKIDNCDICRFCD